MELSRQAPQFYKIILHFRPHQFPWDPSEGYPGPPKTDFLETKQHVACGVSTESSHEAHQFFKIILHFRSHQVSQDPSEGYPETLKNRFSRNKVIFGMRGVNRI